MFPGTEPIGVEEAVAGIRPGRWLVAVSGGRDSMGLLHALLTLRPGEIAAVATFDHGTGEAARRGVDLVQLVCAEARVKCRIGRADRRTPPTEAGWRRARWRFLTEVARAESSVPVTAHTRDDQVETVLLRLLRHAGPRGLAAMKTALETAPLESPRTSAGRLSTTPPVVARPLLGVDRADLAAYVAHHNIPFAEDPSNTTSRFLRNRVRHEILPALERAQPGFAAWCLDLGRRAAAWRADLDTVVDGLGLRVLRAGVVALPVASIAGLDASGWEALWPAVAARAGVVLDRRGIARAARWAPGARTGQYIPVSGGHRIERTARTFVVRRSADAMGTSGWPEDYIDG
ncbi:MAG: tRNA lysidine(34) synthetase TilS [Gemmatimonadetes bacterium]|nr:tRNA lysidine(34) synthetase TilS [Gemmatimonadota bacterium]